MDNLLVALFEIVLEIIGEFLLQMIFELTVEALSGLMKRGREVSPAASAIGVAFVGAASGLLSVWLFPHRLIATRVVVPGLSLLLAPLATGSVMHFVGKRLSGLGRDPSNLATFWGGVLFAFAMTLIRWWLVGINH